MTISAQTANVNKIKKVIRFIPPGVLDFMPLSAPAPRMNIHSN